jgi:replicative DNA helicase
MFVDLQLEVSMKLSAPVYILKSQAKELKKSQGIPMVEALNLIAKREGFSSWSLLHSKSDDLLPTRREDVLGFFNPGDLVLIGGRPSMGKTNFTISLFVQAIRQIASKHFLFTLEEIHKAVARRMACYDESIGKSDEKFSLDYSNEISAGYIIEKTKNQISQSSVVVVDYLQLLDHKRSNPPLQEQIEMLKVFAKEKGCILILISQIRREIESRLDKRPNLEDIKLFNPLDLNLFNKILFLYRSAQRPNEAEVIFRQPVNHDFKIIWDDALIRFF